KWRSLRVLILTVKDLTERERETLNAHSATVFEKGSGWRPLLLAHLRKLARPRRGIRRLHHQARDNREAQGSARRRCLNASITRKETMLARIMGGIDRRCKTMTAAMIG